jgi:hypothetical protein
MCDLYITTYNKQFNHKTDSTLPDFAINEKDVYAAYGNYIKQLTIIDQEPFNAVYDKIPDKKYKFPDVLNRLYTIEKLVQHAYTLFTQAARCPYDIILKIRPDILLNAPIPLDTFPMVVPLNNSGGDFNDHIAYGPPNNMAKYLSYYSHFKANDAICDVSIIELGLHMYLKNCNINIIRLPIRYTILRDTKHQKIVYTGTKPNAFFVKRY